jgi:hypothetical protein
LDVSRALSIIVVRASRGLAAERPAQARLRSRDHGAVSDADDAVCLRYAAFTGRIRRVLSLWLFVVFLMSPVFVLYHQTNGVTVAAELA